MAESQIWPTAMVCSFLICSAITTTLSSFHFFVAGKEYLLLGGHGLGTHSVFGLAFNSAMRSLYLALSEDTVL